MRALAGLAVLLALGGCAVPQGAERMAWDAANCRRHALEGPGGPSQQVSSSLGVSTPNRNSRRGNTAAAPAGTLLASRDHDPALQTAMTMQSAYWDCMRVRGYPMPGPGQPLSQHLLG